MAIEIKKSFCRICSGMCGTTVTVEDGRMTSVRGDHDDPMTTGYACIKGIEGAAAHYAPDRITEPLKRQPDGSFAPIGIEQALDEIAEKLAVLIASDGPQSIGGYRGGGAFLNNAATNVCYEFINAIGSDNFFSTITIDQSAKIVSIGRLGIWAGGRQQMPDAEVALLVGINPLVSISGAAFDTRNPARRMKDARARGMKVIVIDPRRTETAAFADVFLQPYPGEDPTLLAGLIRIILSEGWEDKPFCDAWVGDLAALGAAVDPFTPEYVARRAGVEAADLVAAAAMFARDNHRGYAASGTGPNMSPHSNLSEHLLETINVLCGRYQRAGERVYNPGILQKRTPKKAQVIPAPRWWETAPRSRIGNYPKLFQDMPTGVMAAEMLEPGPGQVKAFLCHGSNIVNSVPDQYKVTKALRALELLVCVEPFMNETARLAHYILPPPMMYERADLTGSYAEAMLFQAPFARYTAPVVPPPPGTVDDCYVFWGLAKRLGVQLVYDGVPLDMETPPTTDSLLSIIARHAPEPWEQFKSYELGKLFEDYPQIVEPADADATGRFTTMPADVAAELGAIAAAPVTPGMTTSHGNEFPFRLAVRRVREIFNSSGRNVAALHKRMPINLAYMNPADLAMLGVADGEKVAIASDYATVPANAAADATVRRGVVSMTHGFGTLPEETVYERDGSSTSMLISTDRDLDPLNAMPRMSAIPVKVTRTNAAEGAIEAANLERMANHAGAA